MQIFLASIIYHILTIVRVRNRRPRPTGVNWATLPPELSDLAPLRDLRRSQRLRDKRKELKNQTTGSSSDGSLNGTENTTINSSTGGGGSGATSNGENVENPPISKSSNTPPNGGMINDFLLPGTIDALCTQMQENLNHENVDCTPKNQLRV